MKTKNLFFGMILICFSGMAQESNLNGDYVYNGNNTNSFNENAGNYLSALDYLLMPQLRKTNFRDVRSISKTFANKKLRFGLKLIENKTELPFRDPNFNEYLQLIQSTDNLQFVEEIKLNPKALNDPKLKNIESIMIYEMRDIKANMLKENAKRKPSTNKADVLSPEINNIYLLTEQ